MLRAVRGALFPNNAPGVSTLIAPSSDEALLALRRRCASALYALLPRWLARLYLGGRGLGDRTPPPWRPGPQTPGGGSCPASGAGAAPGEEGKAAVGHQHGQAAKRHEQQHANGPQRAAATANREEEREEERVLAEIEEGILDVFSDEYCNRHLLYGILELVLVRLMPELAEKGVAELWEERLS